MRKTVRAGAAVLGAGLLGVLPLGAASAASDVDVGGYHDMALRAAQRSLLAESPEVIGSRFQVTFGSEPSTAVTAFTPRLGGLGLGMIGLQEAPPGGRTGLDPAPVSTTAVRQLELGLGGGTIAGVPVGIAATAQMSDPASTGESGLAVGGELALSGVRIDASYGEDAALMGLAGTRMTAGVAYGFGPLDTRMSYSLVERETAVDTSLITVGSRLTLRPGLVVQGDVAYADDEDGDATTAGRVSLRFNF